MGAHAFAVERAFGRYKISAKRLGDGGYGQAMCSGDAARDGVCVNQGRAAFHKHGCHTAFAAANAAGEA